MTRTNERGSADLFLAICVVLAVVIGGSCLGYASCETRTSPGTGPDEAARWLRKNYDIGPNQAKLDCVSRDSDGDGYLSCTFIPPGESRPVGIECSTGFFLTACNNTGCRVTGAVR